jgi:uncharacterized protein YoxC
MKKLFSYLLISSMVILSSCTNYDDQFDDLNSQIKSLKSQIEGFSSLSSGLTALQGTVAALQTAVAAIPTTKTDISGLEASVATLQASLANAATSAEAAAIQTQLTSAQTALASAIAANATASETNASAIADLLVELESLATTLAGIKTDLAAADTTAQVATLTTALAAAQADLKTLLAQNNVYTPGTGGLVINTAASLEVANSLGSKLTIINGDLTVTNGTSNSLDATKLQSVLDKMVTITGSITYTQNGDGPAANFTKLSSAGHLKLDVEHAISLPVLSSVGNLVVVDDNKVTSFSAPSLSSLTKFNDGTTDNKLALQRATSIDLSALAAYDNAASLTIEGNALSAGFDLTMPNIQSKTSASIVRGFTLTIGGYVNLVELDKMTYSGSTITANDAKKIVLDNFEGTLSSGASTNHVNVELGKFKMGSTGYVAGAKLETFKSTGVLLSSLATAVGPAYDFTSASKLVSAEILGHAGAITFDNNDNVETVTISANATSVDLTDSSSLETVVISGDVDGTIDFTDSIALTSVTISGDANKVDLDSNTSLTSVSLTGGFKEVIVEDADALTALNLAHTTAFPQARTSTTAVAAADKSATLTVINNDELATLAADKVTLVGSLNVYSNPVLSSVSFDAITVPGTSVTSATVQIGATGGTTTITAAANNLHAQSKSLSDNVVVSATSTKRSGSITTNSGLADLATYLSGAVAKATHNVAVIFDQVDSFTDEAGNNDTNITYDASATATNSGDTKASIVTVANSKNNSAVDSGATYFANAYLLNGVVAGDVASFAVAGGLKSFTMASTGETNAEYAARIAADALWASLPVTVTSGTTKLHTKFTVTSTTVSAGSILMGSAIHASTATGTVSSRLELTSAFAAANTGSSTTEIAAALAATISGTSFDVWSGTASGAWSATSTNVFYADNVGAELRVYSSWDSESGTGITYAPDWTSAPGALTVHGTAGNIDPTGSEPYVKFTDTVQEDGAFTVTIAGTNAAKFVAIADEYTSTQGSGSAITKTSVTGAIKTNELTQAQELVSADAATNGRGYSILSSTEKLNASPVYVTTYWTWN